MDLSKPDTRTVYPNLPKDIIDQIPVGKNRCYCERYSSNTKDVPKQVIEWCVSHIKPKPLISLESWKDGAVIAQLKTSTVFEDGLKQTQAHPSGSILKGNYVVLAAPYHSDEPKLHATSRVQWAANILRVVLGEDFCSERHHTVTYELSENSWLQEAEYAPRKHIDIFQILKDKSIALNNVVLRPAAIKFFNLYIAEKADQQIRFLLLWTGLEAQLFEKGVSSGQRRKQFIKKLDSKSVDREARRLFDLRCRLLKEGDLVIDAADVTSLHYFFLLACFDNGATRIAVLREYENEIRNTEETLAL
ncbi:MAG: hypothetical protein AB3N19_09240 [Ruegeria sp.]